MRHLFRRSFALLLLGFGLSVASAEQRYVPKAVKVTDNVYAIVGPLGQRSEANAGLNANYGFVVTASGVILIDSGASLAVLADWEKKILGLKEKERARQALQSERERQRRSRELERQRLASQATAIALLHRQT